MHPYDQMLANEWERHVAEEEDAAEEDDGDWLDWYDPNSGASITREMRPDTWDMCPWLRADPDDDTAEQDLDDEKAQERRWRAE